MTRSLVLVAFFIVTNAVAQIPRGVDIRKSLVRITSTSQEQDYKVPWNPGSMTVGVGAGFVIDGNRILTNAHVVSNARFIVVEKEDDPERYPAVVQFVGHDCDLAVLRVLDKGFFQNTRPLGFGGIPTIESPVSVYGYPIGGDRLSVTRGIISRIDFQTYTHSAIDSHLAVQLDAAINPGNSGGPVMQDGKVVGVAFQGFSGDVAQNVGYMIPTPVIQHFLDDIKDGYYDRYMDLSIGIQNTLNPAMRKALGLQDDDKGVMVSSVQSAGVCAGRLEVGDVLLAIDGHEIASDGMLELDGERVIMSEVAERKFLGDSVKFNLLRDNKPMEIVVKFERAFPYTMQAAAYDTQPAYVLFAGLLFQPLSRNLLAA